MATEADLASTPAASDAALSDAAATDVGAPPFYFTMLALAALAGTAHEVLLVQPRLYVGAQASPGSALVGVTGLGAAAVGVLVAKRNFRDAFAALPWAILLASICTAASAPAVYLAFARGLPAFATSLGAAMLTSAALGAVAALAVRAMGRTLMRLEAPWRLTHPFRLLAVTVACAVAAGISSLVGPLRSAIAIAMVLAALAAWSPTLCFFLERRAVARGRLVRGLSLGTFALWLGAFIACELVVPTAEPRALPEPRGVSSGDRARKACRHLGAGEPRAVAGRPAEGFYPGRASLLRGPRPARPHHGSAPRPRAAAGRRHRPRRARDLAPRRGRIPHRGRGGSQRHRRGGDPNLATATLARRAPISAPEHRRTRAHRLARRDQRQLRRRHRRSAGSRDPPRRQEFHPIFLPPPPGATDPRRTVCRTSHLALRGPHELRLDRSHDAGGRARARALPRRRPDPGRLGVRPRLRPRAEPSLVRERKALALRHIPERAVVHSSGHESEETRPASDAARSERGGKSSSESFPTEVLGSTLPRLHVLWGRITVPLCLGEFRPCRASR